MHRFFFLATFTLLVTGCAAKSAAVEPAVAIETEEVAEPVAEPTSSLTAAAAVTWALTNPDEPEGVQWAVIEGNPREGGFTALAKFPAGYANGLHSHPAGFVGVGISGTLQNGRSAEDSAAIIPGTVWSQPANEVHFTGCTEEAECLFVVFMEGALATVPAEDPSEGEMQAVVIAGADIPFVPVNPDQSGGPQVYVVSGDMETGPFRAVVQYPAGASSPEHSHSATYGGVVLDGEMTHGDSEPLGVGSFWTEIGGSTHTTGCVSEEACVFFVAFQGAFDMTPVTPAEGPAEAPSE